MQYLERFCLFLAILGHMSWWDPQRGWSTAFIRPVHLHVLSSGQDHTCGLWRTTTALLMACISTLQDLCTSFAHPCSYYYLLSPSILFFASYLFCTFLFYCTFYSLFLFFYLYLYIYIYIYAPVLLLKFFLHCPLSGPDLICISLLIIPCII